MGIKYTVLISNQLTQCIHTVADMAELLYQPIIELEGDDGLLYLIVQAMALVLNGDDMLTMRRLCQIINRLLYQLNGTGHGSH